MNVRLEPLSETHLPHLEALLADPTILRYTRIPEPPPEGFARTWLERYDGAQRVAFAAFTEDGTFAGLGLLPTIDLDDAEAELGYMVPAALRGRGAGTAILEAITRHAFDALGILRAYLYIDPANVPSQRVAERAGYQLEGVLRSMALKQGRRGDFQVWSRLPSDPHDR